MNKPSEDYLLSKARTGLRDQAAAIVSLADSVSADFIRAVDQISRIPAAGRLLCMGIGKAGFIAMKISATFASLGVASFSIHPSEAAHGDLGRITSADLLLVLSNSGQTLELLNILPAVKRIGCKIITLTGNAESELARASDIILNIGRIKESGPLGIAPTTSTTVMIALGDALATSVLEAKGITAEQFAFNHPGGTIGKSLMLVGEIMRSGESLCTVSEKSSVKEVLHQITVTRGRPGCAVVVDNSGKLCGFFTDGDLRRCLEQNTDFLEKPVSEVMSKNPKTVLPSLLVEEAFSILTKFQIDQVVVSDENKKPLGVVDIQDVVTAY